MIRWTVATLAAVAVFALAWLISAHWFSLDTQSAVAVATAAATIVGAPTIWWASQELPYQREALSSERGGTIRDWGRWRDVQGTPDYGDTADLADQLAGTILLQWRTEERIRRLHDPWPLAMNFRESDRPVMDHWEVIRRIPGDNAADSLVGELDTIVGLFDRLPSRRLVVLGDAGAGKSVMAMRFVVEKLEKRQYADPVPVLLALSSWDAKNEPLFDWVAGRLYALYPGIIAHPAALRRLIEYRRLLLVLDGLDEMPASYRAIAVKSLNLAADGAAGLLVTSRTDEYGRAVEVEDVLTGAAVVELQPVRPSVAIHFLEMTTKPARKARWAVLAREVQVHPGGPVAGAFATPLAVSMARTLYAEGSSDPSELLDRRTFPNRDAIERHLISRFAPAALAGSRLDCREEWQLDRAQRWLEFLAARMQTMRTLDFAWWQLPDMVHPAAVGGIFGAFVGLIAAIPLLVLSVSRSQVPAAGIAVGIGVAYVSFFSALVQGTKPEKTACLTSLVQGAPGWIYRLVASSLVLAGVVNPAVGAGNLVLGCVLFLAAAAVLALGMFQSRQGQILRAERPLRWRLHLALHGGFAFGIFLALALSPLLLAVGHSDVGGVAGLGFLGIVFGCAVSVSFVRRQRLAERFVSMVDPKSKRSVRAVRSCILGMVALAVASTLLFIGIRPAYSAAFIQKVLPSETGSRIFPGLVIAFILVVGGIGAGNWAAIRCVAARHPHYVNFRPRTIARLLASRAGAGFAVGFVLDATLQLQLGWGAFVSSLVADGPRRFVTFGMLDTEHRLLEGYHLDGIPSWFMILWRGILDWFVPVPTNFFFSGIGLCVGLLVGLNDWMHAPATSTRLVTPVRLVQGDRNVLLVTSAIAGLIFGPLGGIGALEDARLDGLESMPAFFVGVAVLGLIAAFCAAMRTTRSSAWAYYRASHLWLALNGLVPWRLMVFLEIAHEAGILRQIGGVYQFRHILLQEQLAESWHKRAG
jgi:hypothetical protein